MSQLAMYMPGHGYLKSFDPDVGETLNGTPVFPTGDAVFTADIAEALKFETMPELFAAYMRKSAAVPLRPDGKPNRPLTAFTMSPATVNSGAVADFSVRLWRPPPR